MVEARPSVQLPKPLADLVVALSQLPGVGPRTAERLALYLVQSDPRVAELLVDALVCARRDVRGCARCGGLTDADPCRLCTDSGRDGSVLCVVERPVDILLFEKSGHFRGRYHVLGGRLSPLNGVEPEDLRIGALEERLGQEGVTEVILALPTDMEGDATCDYLARRLSPRGVKVSRLAHGLPAGASLEFADEVTLSRALEGRQRLEG